MKKLITLFLCIFALFSAFADNDSTKNYYYDGYLVYELVSSPDSTEHYAYVCNPSEYTEQQVEYTDLIQIPNLVLNKYVTRYIKPCAFKNSTIQAIYFSDSLQTIGDSAFYQCVKLSSATQSNNGKGLTEIGKSAFQGCVTLNQLYLLGNAGITELPQKVFADCKALREMTLSPKLTAIDSTAFSGCNGLTKLDVNYCTATINGKMFIDCNELLEINTSDDNTRYFSVRSSLVDRNTNTLVLGTKASSKIFDFTEVVGTSRFCPVETIGDYAFYNREIANVNFPNTVIKIGKYAFAKTKLQAVFIPNKVTDIEKYAFAETPIQRATLGRNIIKADLPFAKCTDLKILLVTSENPFEITFDGNNENLIAVETDSSYINSYKSSPYWNKMTIIESNEFDGTFFFDIEGDYATLKNTNDAYSSANYYDFFTDTISIPEYFTYQNVKYPVNKISDYAFLYIDKFSENELTLKLPSTIKEIGQASFYQGNLKEIIFNDSLKTIGMMAFTSNPLTAIKIPTSVETIGGNAFAYTNLNEVIVPSNIDTLENGTFEKCSNMKKVTLESGVRYLYERNFIYSPNIEKIICKSTTPPAFDNTDFSENFEEILKDYTQILVPKEALTAYQTAPVWKEFTNIKAIEDEPEPTAVENVTAEEIRVENGFVYCNSNFRIYDILGRDVTNQNGSLNGIFIIKTEHSTQKLLIRK